MKKLRLYIVLMFLNYLVTACYPLLIYGKDGYNEAYSGLKVYYVRFDVKSVNNRVERSNLLMVPAEDDFRQKGFKSVVISGSADYSASETGSLDIQTRAIHNAIKNFLEINGLESVKSQSTTVKGLAHAVNEQTVVSFEGAVRLPYKVLDSSFNKESGIYSVTIHLEFAPLAFPDKWEKMLFKHEIKMLFNQFKSFF
ncbi:MAG: hypothetical protein HQK64_08315 [Desulfamplus sp.]|nr:hypothetical protein [Desulfamplus sp.]